MPLTEGKVDTETLHKLATVVTDELLILAWAAIGTVVQLQEPPPTLRAQLRLLAWVVAGAVGGPMLTDMEQAHTVGKRLARQAARVSSRLAHTSAGFDEQRAAAGQDSAAQLAEIDTAEQMALDAMLTEVYNNAVELLPMEPVPHGAPVPEVAPVSERPSLDEYRRLTRQAIALEPAEDLGPFENCFREGYETSYRTQDDEDARVDERVNARVKSAVALIHAEYEAGTERLIGVHIQQLADKEQAHELQL